MQIVSEELILFYNGESSRGKKTLAYAQTLTKRINRQELNSVRVSTTIFRMMLDRLQLRPKDLLNRADPYYQSCVRGRDFAPEQWLDLLRKRPDLLKAPIAMYRGKAIL
ncbi:MAG: glutaredoxin, partial [Catalinimonas sp.]